MKKVRITVLENTFHPELALRYAKPGFGPCRMHTKGQEFISNGWRKPEGFCDNAWKSIQEYVFTLSHGGSDFYDGWMRDKHTAVLSCNDGVRPVIFLVELAEETEQ